MHHSSGSSRSASTTPVNNRDRISSSVPSARQRSKVLYTVFHGPKSGGRSRHGKPVLRIHHIPFSSSRGSRLGRPVAVASGTRSSIKAHSSSFNWCRIAWPPCRNTKHRISPSSLITQFWDRARYPRKSHQYHNIIPYLTKVHDLWLRELSCYSSITGVSRETPTTCGITDSCWDCGLRV
jgi:hypothetical protein